MKKIKFLTVAILAVLSVIIYSCNQDENLIEPNTELSKSELDLKQAVKKRFGADYIKNEDGSFTFIYEDGKTLDVTPNNDGTFLMEGSKISNRIFKVNKLQNLNNPDAMEYSFEVIKDFDSSQGALLRPCGQHPAGENFNACFKREWNEFCDGLVGCLAQATHPVLIAGVIAAHCAAC